jgi:CheY-like chemotaxis protein
MDISMPVMDGLESTRQIRKFEQTQNLKAAKVIALTGLASQQAQDEASASGVDAYLAKPVKFKELRKVLDEGSTT